MMVEYYKPMLEARHISLEIELEDEEENLFLLRDINFCLPLGHFMAIVGPSGCGKSTLLKAIAGIKETTDGSFCWLGRDLEEDGDFKAGEVGYVPQFSIAYDELTVDETVESAANLRLSLDDDEKNTIIDDVLEETGLAAIADRQVKLLSGGQLRRLALAMELVSSPKILLCDEVTSGLDPNSERDIVELLHKLSRREGRIVISVTHSVAQMELYDSIMVLNSGVLAYHGSPDTMAHYFGAEQFEGVYPTLALREPAGWAQSWLKHRKPYYGRLEELHVEKYLKLNQEPPRAKAPSEDDEEDEDANRIPGVFSQLLTMLGRRFTILMRDKTQLGLQIAMIVIFPLMVSLFSGKGQEQLLQLTETASNDLAADIQAAVEQADIRARVGSAVSGIIMFQVILLGLMGSNNASREIAGERLIMEKEKFAGARPLAYLGSKVLFLAVLVLIQSIWMYAFVDYFWPYRGNGMCHFVFLILANAAMTSVCLAISSNCKTPDQSSLLSIYLVGFQLPLSGAVLALPSLVAVCAQPFISAYWAWSGSIRGGLSPDVLKAVNSIVQTDFAAQDLCMIVLILHILVGLIFSYVGVKRSQWN